MTTRPERRTAMFHSQLGMGAVMDDVDGWQLPLHYGDAEQESAWLRDTVGVSDVSPVGKVRIAGEGAAAAVSQLVLQATEQDIGTVAESDSSLERDGKLLSVRLARDEFLVLTPPGVGPAAVGALRSHDPACTHAVDVTSGLCGVAIAGPCTQELMSRITDVNTSPAALADLGCVQSRFADVQGLLLRRDVDGLALYQLYAGREFGEYLWEVLVEVARELAGGPVGAQVLLSLRTLV